MRVVETFTKGGFPKLVLESKRDFASKYGLQAEYWRHFKPEESPEVLAYLKTNLKDLATHYHAEYQSAQEANEKLANYHEAHPMVRRLSQVLPDGRRVAADQLPARGPSLREQGFRRGGQTVRAHGLRIPGKRSVGSRGLRRSLRIPRAAEGRRPQERPGGRQARYGRKLDQICRHVPEPRTGRGGPGSGRR